MTSTVWRFKVLRHPNNTRLETSTTSRTSKLNSSIIWMREKSLIHLFNTQSSGQLYKVIGPKPADNSGNRCLSKRGQSCKLCAILYFIRTSISFNLFVAFFYALLQAKFLDIISFNRYNGWYKNPGKLNMITQQVVDEAIAWNTKHHKPVLMSEYGADTIEGLHLVIIYVQINLHSIFTCKFTFASFIVASIRVVRRISTRIIFQALQSIWHIAPKRLVHRWIYLEFCRLQNESMYEWCAQCVNFECFHLFFLFFLFYFSIGSGDTSWWQQKRNFHSTKTTKRSGLACTKTISFTCQSTWSM